MRLPPNWLQALVITSHLLSVSDPGCSFTQGNARIVPILFQPSVFIIWDVRARFKIKLVTTQLFCCSEQAISGKYFLSALEKSPSPYNCDGL